MATTLAAQTSAGTDTAFISRVQAAILTAAQNISSESTATPNHTNRVALMKSVANSPDMFAPLFALLCAAEGTDTASTDAAISTMVSSVWNTLAGVV